MKGVYMIIPKTVQYIINPGRVLSIRYELWLFDDKTFTLSYQCPFSNELRYKYVIGNSEDIQVDNQVTPIPIEERGFSDTEDFSIVLPHEEGKVLTLPILVDDYDDLLIWLGRHSNK